MTEQPQHLQAMGLANEVRHERHDIRAWVKEPADSYESSLRLAALLEGPVTPGLRNLAIGEFLRWGRRSQPTRRTCAIRFAGCTELRTIGALTERQRTIIARALRMPFEELRAARDLHEFERWHGIAA